MKRREVCQLWAKSVDCETQSRSGKSVSVVFLFDVEVDVASFLVDVAWRPGQGAWALLLA